jgi:DNA repair photolyase
VRTSDDSKLAANAELGPNSAPCPNGDSERSIHGRGSAANPPNRFIPLTVLRDGDCDPADEPAPTTIFLHDTSRSIIAHNDSPDVGFTASINPYRGCEHGCIYCYARPTHEYLGFSAGLDFESKILVKTNAAALLRKELASPRYKPSMLAISGVTDCYQPVERKLKITRSLLEVLLEFRHPVGLITKNELICRDLDLLKELAALNCAAAFVSVTTLDKDISRLMEPRTSVPQKRLDAIARIADAGVPVGVMMAPIIPGLTDHEIPNVIAKAAAAGARFAGYVPVRLPYAVAPLFEDWLARHFPDRKDKVLNRIRSLRGGKLNDPNFNTRMKGAGQFAEQMGQMFALAKRKAGIEGNKLNLTTEHFRRIDPGGQGELF